MGEGLEHFNEQEMRFFGYDPEVKEDRSKWVQTEPAPKEEGAEYDYSQDAAVFGAEAPAEPKPPARSYLGQVRGH